MSGIFIKAKTVEIDTAGKWSIKDFIRINVNHIRSFKIIEMVDKRDEFIMDVVFSGTGQASDTKRLLISTESLHRFVCD